MTTPCYTQRVAIGTIARMAIVLPMAIATIARKEAKVNPKSILDRTEACKALGISRQTLISWIQKGKLKVWKRVGHGSNAALLFERRAIDALLPHATRDCAPTGNMKKQQTADFGMPSETAVS